MTAAADEFHDLMRLAFAGKLAGGQPFFIESCPACQLS
jgi:hypothetical protein